MSAPGTGNCRKSSKKQRVDALVPALIEVAARLPSADITLERLLQLLESVSRRAAYLAAAGGVSSGAGTRSQACQREPMGQRIFGQAPDLAG